MTEMDIDMDIDIGGGPDEDVIEPDSAPVDPQTLPDTSQGPIDAMEGEIQLEKVNIRGLDSLSTNDVKQFAREHYPAAEPEHVQWVDDTSANIVYSTPEIGSEALLAFLAVSIDASEIHTIPDGDGAVAKPLSTQPDVILRVRPAQTTDVKRVGARDASRYYLLNPDKDPREQRERQRRDAIRRKRRREDEERAMRPFDVDMYDDPPSGPSLDQPLSSQPRRRNSDLFDGGYRAKRVRLGTRRGEDLFAGRLAGRDASDRLRDRSASPRKAHEDGDGRYGFSEDAAGVRMRQRSFSPTSFSIRGAASRGDGAARDLFSGSKGPGSGTLFGERVDLFANRTSPLRDTRELFPGRKGSTSSQQHRRTDAMDADDSLIPSPLPSGKVQRTLAERISHPETRSLADRISKPGASLEARIARSSAHMDQENPGFQIRGVAQAKVKELFPDKAGDERRDLFERVKAPRRKAEDLFG